jgi:hypothetical protein
MFQILESLVAICQFLEFWGSFRGKALLKSCLFMDWVQRFFGIICPTMAYRIRPMMRTHWWILQIKFNNDVPRNQPIFRFGYKSRHTISGHSLELTVRSLATCKFSSSSRYYKGFSVMLPVQMLGWNCECLLVETRMDPMQLRARPIKLEGKYLYSEQPQRANLPSKSSPLWWWWYDRCWEQNLLDLLKNAEEQQVQKGLSSNK